MVSINQSLTKTSGELSLHEPRKSRTKKIAIGPSGKMQNLENDGPKVGAGK